MMSKVKNVVNYYRKDGYIFTAEHEIKTVSVPQSVKEEDYPQEIKDFLSRNYFKQLTIE